MYMSKRHQLLATYKMNEIVNKFLLAVKQPGFTYRACGPFTKNKEFKNLKKQEIQAIFTKMNLTRFVFNMTWLMEILKI